MYCCALVLNVHDSIFRILVDANTTRRTLIWNSFGNSMHVPFPGFMPSHLLMQYSAPLKTIRYLTVHAQNMMIQRDLLASKTPLVWGVYEKHKVDVEAVLYLIKKYPGSAIICDFDNKTALEYEITNHQWYNTLAHQEMDVDNEILFSVDVDMDMDAPGWDRVEHRDSRVLVALMRIHMNVEYSFKLKWKGSFADTKKIVQSHMNSSKRTTSSLAKDAEVLLVLNEIELHEKNRKPISSEKLIQNFHIYTQRTF